MKLIRRAITALCAAGMICVSSAHAHDVWVLMPKFHLSPGDSSHVYVGYGFIFPIDEFIFEDWLEKIMLVAPDGKESEVGKARNGYAMQPIDKPGAYVLHAELNNWYYTTTAEGTRYTPKTGLEGVIRCTYHSRDAKAIFNVGDSTGGFKQQAMQPLEIMPLTNPANLKVGDFMEIQVLKDGKPYKKWDASVSATYSGFSFEGADAFRVNLDHDGKASIRITHTGIWMIKAGASDKYHDPDVCDDRRYDTSLTFGIR